VATIQSLLAEHVTLQITSVDRLFLQGYVSHLMTQQQVISFLRGRGYEIASPAGFGKIGRAYEEEIKRYAAEHGIPLVRFERRESKEQRARPYLEAAERDGRFGCVIVGVAQERAWAWRGVRRSPAYPDFDFVRQSVYVNHYYFYVRDREWGPAFLKTCCYAPYHVWIHLNGHEWAKRRAEQRGLDFDALDNGFLAAADAAALAKICASLSARDIERFFRRWLAQLPSPFTAEDRRRGYRYLLAMRQLELSDTRVFDRPQAGRAWFERAINDQLTLGRPDRVALIFDRRITRATPGRFRTTVINAGTRPQLEAHYKHSRIKQYFKQGRALRTETVINDTKDFYVGRLLTRENFQALRQIGEHANQRLLDTQLQACDCAPDSTTLERIVLPSTRDGQRAPALRFGDPRVMALLASLCPYTHLFNGLTNRSLRALIAEHLPGYSARQMTYDLRRLCRKGLLRRLPGSQRYQLTADGRRLAVFFTKTYTRIICPSLTELDPKLPAEIADRHPLARHWRGFERALDTRIATATITTQTETRPNREL
jgi:hypothetical protein